MSNLAEFSKRLRQQRESKSLTQAQLAEQIGVTPQTISAYEKNSGSDKGKTPTLDRALDLSRVLGVTLDYLCGVDTSRRALSCMLTLADAVGLVDALENYFELDVGSTDYPLHPEEYHYVRTDAGDEECISKGCAATITVRDGRIAYFFDKKKKMLGLLNDGTIDQDLYGSWLAGETEKLKKEVVFKRGGIDWNEEPLPWGDEPDDKGDADGNP